MVSSSVGLQLDCWGRGWPKGRQSIGMKGRCIFGKGTKYTCERHKVCLGIGNVGKAQNGEVYIGTQGKGNRGKGLHGKGPEERIRQGPQEEAC